MGAVPSIDPIKAATVGALQDLGYNGRQIARTIGLAASTVYDMLGGRTDYLKRPIIAQLRTQIKSRLQFRSLDLSDRALDQVESTLPWTEARDAAVVYGILRQHERLDAGEPTEITASVNVHVEGKVDDLVQALGAALLIKQSEVKEPIDITPKSEVTSGNR